MDDKLMKRGKIICFPCAGAGPICTGVGSALYAISSTLNNVKGLLVNAYSIYADTASTELIAKLLPAK